jgi:hypothetical protein
MLRLSSINEGWLANAQKPVFTHQLQYSLVIGPDSVARQLRGDPTVTIGRHVRSDRLDLLSQFNVLLGLGGLV